jgi:malonyl-CoA decarboxylase
MLPPAAQAGPQKAGNAKGAAFIELAHALLSSRGEASGVAIAQDMLALYAQSTEEEKRVIFLRLADDFGPSTQAIERAWAIYHANGNEGLPALAAAIEAPRQELFRRLNFARGGTAALVRMRADLLALLPGKTGGAELVDADLLHLLQSWFNRGFLQMKRIDWSSPASLLESVIQFEAVHHINGWDDLRNRLDPPDRRCYAFFHPAMPHDLLIFVEVALTRGMPANVQGILASDREPIAGQDADAACFYSISNCQKGLRGVSFGHFLIKQVAIDLQRELPNLGTFCTLSPLPGFMHWLREESGDLAARLTPEWEHAEAGNPGEMADLLVAQAADYLLNARTPNNLPRDPVARFHLGNGARLERIVPFADESERGLAQSAGLMVNYLYDLPTIAENHEAFAHGGIVAAAPEIARLARETPAPRRGGFH